MRACAEYICRKLRPNNVKSGSNGGGARAPSGPESRNSTIYQRVWELRYNGREQTHVSIATHGENIREESLVTILWSRKDANQPGTL